MNVRRKHIRQLVASLLQRFSVAVPPVPVKRIAEDLGAQVYESRVEDTLSGFLFRQPESGRYIIGVNKAHPLNRQRFTIAHELGHMLLHGISDVHVDRAGTGYARVRLRSQTSAEGVDSEEIEANYFAAELLMPESMVIQELEARPPLDLMDESDGEAILDELAKRFDVSRQAFNIRLIQLGFLEADVL